MISVDEARALVRERAQPIAEAETVPLAVAAGRVLAEPVRADRDDPPFDRAQMDGYAVRSADPPGPRRVVGSVAAGDATLINAIRAKDVAAVRALLKQRADVNMPQGDGATPLHWAAHVDDLTIVDALIRAGARANVANENGFTPIHLACINRNGAMVVPPAHPAMVIHPVAFLVSGPTGGWGALDRQGRPLIDPVHASRGAVIDEIDRLLADTKPVL